MSVWNPFDPLSWARALGIIAIPMFGHERVRAPRAPANNSVLLDGPGSFALTITSSGPIPPQLSKTASWAWSANVRHAIVIDKKSEAGVSLRWDDPDSVTAISLSGGRSTRQILDRFESVPPPQSGSTVIDRALQTFQVIRNAVDDRGGNQLDIAIAFNALLAWVNASNSRQRLTLDEILGQLPDMRSRTVSPQMQSYPLSDLAELLLESTENGYILDSDLLIRHASGTLYQEAHRQLAETHASPTLRQLNLFEGSVLPPQSIAKRNGPPRDVHYTPQSLARLLAEFAIAECDHFIDCPTVLDPACGSGVFLNEAIREYASEGIPTIRVVGIDVSPVAASMASFCVSHVARSFGDGIESTVTCSDALETEWGAPSVILMNPPFKAWEHLTDAEKQSVQTCLGELMSGRPDLSFAFVVRAARALPPGAAMATLVPASFLKTRTAQPIREWLNAGEFSVRMIGLFRDFNYFEDAMVEPAFFVIARNPDRGRVRQVIAESGWQESAIRWLRRHPESGSVEHSGFEVRSISPDNLRGREWTPVRKQQSELVELIRKSTKSTVGDFFEVRLGVRAGHKKAFVLNDADYRDLVPTSARRFFRPTADIIEAARIVDSEYFFYPYLADGSLAISTEAELQDFLPRFYSERLLPLQKKLSARKSHYREWWEPTRPVSTWLGLKAPRLVSKTYGSRGSFALDSQGNHAVVQGIAWCWKLGALPPKTLYAYLAITNSKLFWSVAKVLCRVLNGGQLDLSPVFIKNVPLPSLGEYRDELAELGAEIHAGNSYSSARLERAVAAVYRIGEHGISTKHVERRFNALADEWLSAVQVYSLNEQRIRHPAYHRIVEMGDSALPFVLTSMEKNPRIWSEALNAIKSE